jgi:hypothetical protein
MVSDRDLIATHDSLPLKVEFHTAIGAAFPQIILLLENSNPAARRAGANVLSELSKQCEISAICL